VPKDSEEVRKLLKELLKSQKETDRMMKETDKRMKEITDGQARFIEGLASPSAERIFEEMGYQVMDILHRRKIKRNGKIVAEIDTMMELQKDGRKILGVGEASSHMTADKVLDFIECIKNLRNYLTLYRNYTIIGFVAGSDYDKGVDKFAIRNELYVLKPSGEQMVLDVPRGFKPKIW